MRLGTRERDPGSKFVKELLTIILRARMGSESIAHEAEGSEEKEDDGNNYFSKIQLVGQ